MAIFKITISYLKYVEKNRGTSSKFKITKCGFTKWQIL